MRYPNYIFCLEFEKHENDYNFHKKIENLNVTIKKI